MVSAQRVKLRIASFFPWFSPCSLAPSASKPKIRAAASWVTTRIHSGAVVVGAKVTVRNVSPDVSKEIHIVFVGPRIMGASLGSSSVLCIRSERITQAANAGHWWRASRIWRTNEVSS